MKDKDKPVTWMDYEAYEAEKKWRKEREKLILPEFIWNLKYRNKDG